MAESGAGMQVAEFFIKSFGIKNLPWAMLIAGFIIGIPVFFEVGILILLPLVISIHKTTKQNILLIALPKNCWAICRTRPCSSASRGNCKELVFIKRILGRYYCIHSLLHFCSDCQRSYICEMDS